MNDLHIQGLIDFYEESNAEKSKLRLKTIENNLMGVTDEENIFYKLQNVFLTYFFHF